MRITPYRLLDSSFYSIIRYSDHLRKIHGKFFNRVGVISFDFTNWLFNGWKIETYSSHSSIPFNIQGLRVISYDTADVDSYAQIREKIQTFIMNGLSKNIKDSPVLDQLPDLINLTADQFSL